MIYPATAQRLHEGFTRGRSTAQRLHQGVFSSGPHPRLLSQVNKRHRSDLEALMKKLSAMGVHFIRCFRPNKDGGERLARIFSVFSGGFQYINLQQSSLLRGIWGQPRCHAGRPSNSLSNLLEPSQTPGIGYAEKVSGWPS